MLSSKIFKVLLPAIAVVSVHSIISNRKENQKLSSFNGERNPKIIDPILFPNANFSCPVRKIKEYVTNEKFFAACRNDDIDTIKDLFEQGIDINASDRNGN